MTISVFPQVNVAIRTSLQSLREKIEQLRELLLRAVSTRQMYLYQRPCPSGLWAQWKICCLSSVTCSGFSSHSLCQRLCHQNFLCAAGCYFHGSCSTGRAGYLWGPRREPGSGHFCVTWAERSLRTCLSHLRAALVLSMLCRHCWCIGKVTCPTLNWPGGILS